MMPRALSSLHFPSLSCAVCVQLSIHIDGIALSLSLAAGANGQCVYCVVMAAQAMFLAPKNILQNP